MVLLADQHTHITQPGWAFSDPIHQLWNARSGEVYPIAADIAARPLTLGRSSRRDIYLTEETCSRKHAELARREEALWIHDLKSTHGVLVNDIRHDAAMLRPGDELRLGHALLVAESETVTALRTYLSRYLGYSFAGNDAVSLALRSLRWAANRRGVLCLRGEGDLPAIAAELHARVLGPARPFICCTPGLERHAVEALERAWEHAAGGTLCIRNLEETGLLENLLGRFLNPKSATQIVLTSPVHRPVLDTPIHQITLPSCLERWGEIDRIIEDSVVDVCESLALPTGWWTSDDTVWVKERDARSITAIEDQVRRIACNRFGIAPPPKAPSLLRRVTGSVRRWVTNAPIR